MCVYVYKHIHTHTHTHAHASTHAHFIMSHKQMTALYERWDLRKQ